MLALLGCGVAASAQTVYSVNYKSDADVKVYVANNKSDADLVVYKCKYKSELLENILHIFNPPVIIFFCFPSI